MDLRYRVLRRNISGREVLQVHSVLFEDGCVAGWDAEPAYPQGDDFNELMLSLHEIEEAFSDEVLDEAQLIKEIED